MKAIQTEYFGPGNVRGARYVARDGDGNRVTLSSGGGTVTDTEMHAKACIALCRKMGWRGVLVKGWLKRGVWVWVWRQSGLQTAEEIVA